MKKLLPVATLLTLATSGMASAAFTDAEAGAWTNNLEFNGTITNTNPVWKYQIPETTVEAAQNWDASRETGLVEDIFTNFVFPDKNLVLLQGVIGSPARNGIGMQPLITLGGYTWDTSKGGLDTSNSNYVPSEDAMAMALPTDNGSLHFYLKVSTATQFNDDRGRHATDGSYQPFSDNARTILMAQPWYAETYTGETKEFSQTDVASTATFTQPWANSISSAIEVTSSDFYVRFPTASIPETWAAALPISITHK